MSTRTALFGILLLCLLIFAVSCQKKSPEPTSAPEPTILPEPTADPSPEPSYDLENAPPDSPNDGLDDALADLALIE